jgi:hypothetical protein
MIIDVRRTLEVLLVAMIAAPFAGVGVVLVLPGQITRSTLGDSVASTVTDESGGAGYTAACSGSIDRSWRCDLTTTDQSDTGVIYRLTTSGNCWTGRLVNAAGMTRLPGTSHSCIQLSDELLG